MRDQIVNVHAGFVRDFSLERFESFFGEMTG